MLAGVLALALVNAGDALKLGGAFGRRQGAKTVLSDEAAAAPPTDGAAAPPQTPKDLSFESLVNLPSYMGPDRCPVISADPGATKGMEMKIYDTLEAYNKRWAGLPAFEPKFKTQIFLYIWPSYGFQDERERSFYVEGLCNHPYVKIIDNVAAADAIVFITVQQMKPHPLSDWFIDHMPPPEVVPKQKLICVDQADNMAAWGISPKGPGTSMPNACSIVFKRSTVYKISGVSAKHTRSHSSQENEPITYPVADINVAKRTPWAERNVKILSTLREDNYWNEARKRVMGWLRGALRTWGVAIDGKTVIVGEVSKTTHHSWDNTYTNTLRHAQIIVTCNPATWEGDQRLWEALASGALVFVDKMLTPLEFPLKHKEHVIFYDVSRNGKAAFTQQLKYYFEHPEEADKIAKQGFEFALKYHREVNRVDYILSTLQKKGGLSADSIKRSRQKFAEQLASGYKYGAGVKAISAPPEGKGHDFECPGTGRVAAAGAAQGKCQVKCADAACGDAKALCRTELKCNGFVKGAGGTATLKTFGMSDINIARLGKANQSSISFDAGPNGAIDGFIERGFNKEKCIYTEGLGRGPQWWWLDLGKSVFIKNVTLHGVLDGPAGLSDDLVIMVGDGTADQGTLNPACGGSSRRWHAGQKAQEAHGSPRADVECNLQGRYVVVKKHPSANLGIVLCEIQVWQTGWKY